MTLAPLSTVGTWTGDELAHEAFTFMDDAAVRERCIPFVAEALNEGQGVVVMAGEQVRAMLWDEFGALTADFAAFEASEDSWLGGPGTLIAYMEAMRPLLESGHPWRLIGEPTWMAGEGGHPWSRYEAIANEALADYPYYSLCLHDTRRLSPGVVRDQLRVHPMVWDCTAPAANPLYEPTDAFLGSVQPPWSTSPWDAHAWRFADARGALPQLEQAMLWSVLDSRAMDAQLAVYELVTNAIRAAGSADVRRWVDDGSEIWEVQDTGPGMHSPSAGYRPPSETGDFGRGLWLARSLADETAVRPHGPGTGVRLYFSLARDRAGE